MNEKADLLYFHLYWTKADTGLPTNSGVVGGRDPCAPPRRPPPLYIPPSGARILYQVSHPCMEVNVMDSFKILHTSLSLFDQYYYFC